MMAVIYKNGNMCYFYIFRLRKVKNISFDSKTLRDFCEIC